MLALLGKFEDVKEKIKDMLKMSGSGGGVIYEGARRDGEEPVVVRLEISKGKPFLVKDLKPMPFDIRPSRELYDHSMGFSWGYSGSGPAQLALAILLDVTGNKEIALQFHQEFKECFVAGWGKNWRINAAQVRAWVEMKAKAEVIKEYMRSLGDGQ